jgi:hypothetical protein
MRRRMVFGFLVAALSVVLTTTFVTAAPRLDAHIKVRTTLPAGPDVFDQFFASGPAVDAGLLCSTGHVSTSPVDWSAPLGGGTFAILSMIKYFVCDDGSGTFDVELRVRCDLLTGNTSGRWSVVAGTGNYANLTGYGGLLGIYRGSDNTVLDVYDGKLK